MKAYRCQVCGNPLYFENSVCVSCGTRLGYSREERAIVPVEASGRWRCRNLLLSGCTWLTDTEGGQCFACDLTRTRPADGDVEGLAQFPVAERAKRQLVVELEALGFPLDGLAFDLLSSSEAAGADVVIGHADGVVTIDLAESDDARRERIRAELGEPYRTMLGHFRHEVGHFVQWRLVQGDLVAPYRDLFGDETADYQAAIDRHYAEGPPAGWEDRYITAYATMHPFEDFAETFAHHLHIRDTVETAVEHGLIAPPAPVERFSELVTGVWVPLAVALNMINRSMGKDDLYPFVIAPPVLEKLDFVAALTKVEE